MKYPYKFCCTIDVQKNVCYTVFEVIKVYNINVEYARNNLYDLVNMAINDSEVINISTKNGNAVLISEADYNSLIETLYLSSDPAYKKSLIEGKETPLSDCISDVL